MITGGGGQWARLGGKGELKGDLASCAGLAALYGNLDPRIPRMCLFVRFKQPPNYFRKGTPPHPPAPTRPTTRPPTPTCQLEHGRALPQRQAAAPAQQRALGARLLLPLLVLVLPRLLADLQDVVRDGRHILARVAL